MTDRLPRHQFVDPADRMPVGDPREGIAQIRFWVQIIELRGLCRAANYAERTRFLQHLS